MFRKHNHYTPYAVPQYHNQTNIYTNQSPYHTYSATYPLPQTNFCPFQHTHTQAPYFQSNISFVTQPQMINNLLFDLPKNNRENVEQMLNTIPSHADRLMFFTKPTTPKEAGADFQVFLWNSNNYKTKGNDLQDLVYFIYDRKKYIGFGILQFFGSENGRTNSIEDDLTPTNRSKIARYIDVPHVSANILIAIHPYSRGKGYGSRLVQGLLNILAEQTTTNIAYYVSLTANIGSIEIAKRNNLKLIQVKNGQNIYIKTF